MRPRSNDVELQLFCCGSAVRLRDNSSRFLWIWRMLNPGLTVEIFRGTPGRGVKSTKSSQKWKRLFPCFPRHSFCEGCCRTIGCPGCFGGQFGPCITKVGAVVALLEQSRAHSRSRLTSTRAALCFLSCLWSWTGSQDTVMEWKVFGLRTSGSYSCFMQMMCLCWRLHAKTFSVRCRGLQSSVKQLFYVTIHNLLYS